MNSKYDNPLNKINIIIGGLILAILLNIILAIMILNPNANVLESLGGLGSFIGGIIGTLVAAIALIYLKKTYDLQKTELEKTREQLELQQNHIIKQQFESTFFKMLDMIHSLSMEFQNTNKDFFREFINKLNNVYSAANGSFKVTDPTHLPKEFQMQNILYSSTAVLKLINDPKEKFYTNRKFNFVTDYHNENYQNATSDSNFRKDLILWLQSEIKNDKKIVGYLFEEVFESYNSELGHFFRYIHNTIYFAIKERKELYQDEDFYINLIQAQLTNSQLAVLFYYAISPLSINKHGEFKFHEDSDKYQLFKNIDSKSLLDKKHTEYYPKTTFKYISTQ